MVTSLQLAALKGKRNHSLQYAGPVLFDGEQVPKLNTPTFILKQILNSIDRADVTFTPISIIGKPDSGKTRLANMLAHMIHTAKPEFAVAWAGSNELRRIKDYIDGLNKGQSYILIFDDTSNALDALSGEELSDAFIAYTKGRHSVKARLVPIIIYHYSFSLRKNFRAMSDFNIFLTCTPTEYGNILALIRGNKQAYYKLKQFQRLYTNIILRKSFDLPVGNGTVLHYEDSKPFRVAYALTPGGPTIMLSKIMDCNLCRENRTSDFIDPIGLIEQGKKSYRSNWNLALSLVCARMGVKDAMPNSLREAMDFFVRVLGAYNTDYQQLAKLCVKARIKTKEKRYYRKRKQEDENFYEVAKQVIKKDMRDLSIRVLEGFDWLGL